MRIGIILHPYNEKKPAGLGGYILELAKNLIQEDKNNEYIFYIKGKTLTLAPKASHLGGQVPLSLQNAGRGRIYGLGFGLLWRDLGLFFAPKADVYIFNTPIMPLFFRPKKSIVIALDFAYLYSFNNEDPHPNPLPLRGRGSYQSRIKELGTKFNKLILFNLNKFSLQKADKIVAISEATKNDIIKFFGIDENKITVIYPGFRDMGAIKSKALEIGAPFFLYVGVIKERKNALNIVKAFIEFRKKTTPHPSPLPAKREARELLVNCKLVVAGKGGGEYLEKIIDLIRQEKMESEIIFPDYVDINELAWLYKNAEALVFPSLIEGFGFPLLEAMSAGAPVITSNISSLAEVVGNTALLVDPLNIYEISEAMRKIASDENLRQDLIKNGYERIKNFSWVKCAMQFIKIL